jgi:hypothetical protein
MHVIRRKIIFRYLVRNLITSCSQRSTTESGTEVFDILSSMSELLLRSGGNNLKGVALNMTQEHATTFVAQTEKFVDELDERFSGIENSSISE